MKIGILTFHYAHNYGAVLQAYALCAFLQNKGYVVKVIDYRLPFIYNQYLPLDFSYFYHQYRLQGDNMFISFLRALNFYRTHRHRNEQWKKFNKFIRKKIPLTKRVFKLSRIDNLNLDVLICGSDQIWNHKLTNRLEPAYFCVGFGNGKHIISYAASNGSDLFDEFYLNKLRKYLAKFSAISIREKGLSIFLSNHGIENTCVLDPIFLLRKEAWAEISSKEQGTDYLLTYSFSENDIFFDEVISFAKKRGLKVISILFSRDDSLSDEIIQVTDAGPQDFLGYFRNASFVITNSFHGTAFSILFEKQFFCVPPQKNRERIYSLLSSIGLQNRIQSKDFNEETKIDYRIVDEKLSVLREQSWNFLYENLKS